MAFTSLRISSRFALVLVVLVPSVLAVTAIGFHGLQSDRDSANSLYSDHLLATEDVSALETALQQAEQVSLEQLLAGSVADRQQLTTQLVVSVSPTVESSLAAVVALSSDDPAERGSAQTITTSWANFQTLLASGTLAASTPATQAGLAKQVTSTFDVATTAAQSIDHVEATQADQAHRDALATYRSSVELMLLVGLIGLLLSVGIVVWLIRSVLPRTLAYSAFAAQVRQGDYSHRLKPGGNDELAQLGKVLDELAERRQTDDTFDRNQLDLIDTLQLTESEQEAHDLLKRHLERSVPGNRVTILNRNNSADRLQAMTAVDAASPLAAGLESAKPRSCLAVRKARPHTSSTDHDTLLACTVCSGCPGLITCTPLVVGGEVIGSVLANHEHPLDDNDERVIREAVTQAAPVMGNLRNLAIAELRAATDGLTGLPNRRAIQDTIRRMVAQSSRTMTPLAALMCDLDHFKRINDQYGHGRGDDVLAAVGAALSSSIRASDFAGRHGGEEFIVLLPETDGDGAHALAEKIRAAVAAIRVPTVEQPITISIGIAVFPEHALDSDTLEQAADRALYTAKNAGRDRIERFTSQLSGAEQPPAPSAANGQRRRPVAARDVS
jgi:diguanylate cyclase (GGDEF)-like protein